MEMVLVDLVVVAQELVVLELWEVRVLLIKVLMELDFKQMFKILLVVEVVLQKLVKVKMVEMVYHLQLLVLLLQEVVAVVAKEMMPTRLEDQAVVAVVLELILVKMHKQELQIQAVVVEEETIMVLVNPVLEVLV
jgi:hypothetical protein